MTFNFIFFNFCSFIAGKAEVSAIVYKAGECMQELLKSWKEFEASQDPKNYRKLTEWSNFGNPCTCRVCYFH